MRVIGVRSYGLSPREKLKHRLKSAIRPRGPPHPRRGSIFYKVIPYKSPKSSITKSKTHWQCSDSVVCFFAVCFHSLQLRFFLEWGYEYRVPLTSRMNNRLYYGNWSYLQSGVCLQVSHNYRCRHLKWQPRSPAGFSLFRSVTFFHFRLARKFTRI